MSCPLVAVPTCSPGPRGHHSNVSLFDTRVWARPISYLCPKPHNHLPSHIGHKSYSKHTATTAPTSYGMPRKGPWYAHATMRCLQPWLLHWQGQVFHRQSASGAFIPKSLLSFEHRSGLYAFRDRGVWLLALAPEVLASCLLDWPWMRSCGSGRGAWDIRRREERVVRLESFL